MRTLTITGMAVLSAAAIFISNEAGAQTRAERLTSHVYYMASDSLKGRKAGSEDAMKAATYLIGQYEAMGVKPYFDSWFMPFMGGRYQNVVGVIEGTDPVLKNEYIVLGAHYDHLGVKNGKVYNGADDNASGSAMLVEVARALMQDRESLRRTVVIAAFDAEELGLFGSNALSDTLVASIGKDAIKLMMSMDMVGWYKTSGKLVLQGYATIRNGKSLLMAESEKFDINVEPKRFEKSIMGATDTRGFATKGIPTLYVTTGLKSPYHKPEDDADLIDYEGMDKITGYIASLAEEIASDEGFTPSGRVSPIHSGPRRVQIGLTASAGNSHLGFPDAGFDGKTIFAWDAGLLAKLNFGKRRGLAIQSGVLYSHEGSMFPDTGDLFNKSGRYVRNSVTVPAVLMLQRTGNEFGVPRFFVGFGGYWSHPLKETLDLGQQAYKGNQTGLYTTLGFQEGPISMSLDFGSSLKGIFQSDAPAKAVQHFTLFRLGYFF